MTPETIDKLIAAIKKINIIYVLAVILILLLLRLILSYVTTSTIEVDLSSVSTVGPVAALVQIDGKDYALGENKKLRASVSRGGHQVFIKTQNNELYTEEFSSFFKKNHRIVPELRPLSAEAIAKSLFPISTDECEYVNPSFYGERSDWMLFSVVCPVDEYEEEYEGEEGTVVLAKLDPYELEWRIVARDVFEESDLSDAPQEVISILQGEGE